MVRRARQAQQGHTVVEPVHGRWHLCTSSQRSPWLRGHAGGERARTSPAAVDAIMAAMYDRLCDHREGTRFADVLEAAGVMDMLLVKGSDIDLRTADGRDFWRDRASAAEDSGRGWNSGKVKDSKERIARNSRWCWWRCLGYDTVNDHPKITPRWCHAGGEPDRSEGRSRGVRDGESGRQRQQGGDEAACARFHDGLGQAVDIESGAARISAIAGLASLNGEVLRGDDGEPLPVQWRPIITAAEDHALLKERLAVGAPLTASLLTPWTFQDTHSRESSAVACAARRCTARHSAPARACLGSRGTRARPSAAAAGAPRCPRATSSPKP